MKACAYVLGDRIIENGWIDENMKNLKAHADLVVAAIPIMRLLVVVSLFYAAVVRKEDS